MSDSFTPRMDILPAVQRRLWAALRGVPGLGFTLYGGTAIALRLGHRESVDFDFFGHAPLDRESLRMVLPSLSRAVTLQDSGNTWVVLAEGAGNEGGGVKLSFFGAIGFGRVGSPQWTDDGVLRVASLDDLMATKVKVVLQRAEAKDYRDIAAMIRAGADLPRALASARLLFGPNFQPNESLKALTYFGDGDLKTLADTDKQTLVGAVKEVRELPVVELCSLFLDDVHRNEPPAAARPDV